MLEAADAALVIGDPALYFDGEVAASRPGRGMAAADRACPSCTPSGRAARVRCPPPTSRRLQQALREGLQAGRPHRRALRRPGRAAEDEPSPGRTRPTCARTCVFTLGEEEQRGLREFYRRAHALGLIPRLPELRFHGELETSRPRSSRGERLSREEGIALLRDADLLELGMLADAVRWRLHPEPLVTYIIDRNINYTNVCTAQCAFCAFYRDLPSKEGYVLTKAQLTQKIEETIALGGRQILLQGGLHPDLGIEYYEELFRWMKATWPQLWIHGLSPAEVKHIERVSSLDHRRGACAA